MMFRSLYSKLTLVMMFLFCFIGIIVVVVINYATDMYLQEVRQKLNRDLADNLAKENIFIENETIDHAVLEHVFHQLMVINPSIELYLLDTSGKILDYSAEPGKVKRERVSLEPVTRWVSGKKSFPLLGDDPRDISRQKIFSAARIPQSGRLEGYLYIILGGEDYDTVAEKIEGSLILKMSAGVIVAGFLAAVLTGLILFSMLTRRLTQLNSGIEAFKRGESLTGIHLPRIRQASFTGDEVDNLSQTFRDMAERIEEQIERLQKSDLLRRELVANVSHDLRTPLATLTAYIETMQLKEKQLSAAERLKYLKIANKHCKRLRSLVDNLFELASLDSKETRLNLEPFNIAELIQDVVQNFELPAKKKGVELTSNIGQELALVVGDIGLIERVLENLIMNALRHTPANGTVSIILSPSSEYVKIQVLDTGCGIAEDVLPHVFDRFYKNNCEETPLTSFSGLGLAIAKRILDLHNSDIEVESELSSGTRFAFKLPVQ